MNEPSNSPPPIKWTPADSDWAWRKWNATCGPHAIGAALGIHIKDVQPHLENYRGYMNPTMVTATLTSIGTTFRLVRGLKTDTLCNGINRVQWEGDWLKPGRPPAEAYKHTHYIAHFDGWILCTTRSADEWITVEDWKAHLVSRNVAWHVTHWWKVEAPR